MKSRKAELRRLRTEFKKDPSVIRRVEGQLHGYGGPPPEGHVAQCEGFKKGLLTRCRGWAMKGSRFCRVHGGRHQGTVRRPPMGNYLTKRCSQKLKDRMEEIARDGDTHDLSSEVEFAKQMATEACLLYDTIVVQGKLSGQPTEEASKILAAQAMRNALDFIRGMKESSAKVLALRKDHVPAVNIKYVAYQIAKIIDDELATATSPLDGPATAERMKKRIDELKILVEGEEKPRVVLNIS